MSRTAAAITAGAMTVALVLAGPGALVAQAQGDVDDVRTISVAGVGEAEVEPDEAVVRFGVTTRAASAKAATRRAAAKMESVIASLLDSGVAEEDIRTTRLELRQYRDRDRETREVTTGWQVKNRVRATISDVEATGDVIDAVIAAGATNVDGVRFEATDPAVALGEARAQAVASAETAASQLAEAAGVEVIGVRSIIEGGSRGYSPYLDDGPYFAAESARAYSSTPIVPGMIDIAVTVYVEYDIG